MGKKINWHNEEIPKIKQVYNKGLEYALISDENKQICPFVYCKDFLQDVVYSSVNSRAIKIHKFEYDPYKDGYVTTEKTRILIANANDIVFFLRLPAVLDFLHQIETCLGLAKTELIGCEDIPEKYKSGVFLLEADYRWLLSPPLLSLYSLLTRIGFVHEEHDSFKNTILKITVDEIKTYQKEDRRYVIKSLNGFDRILSEGVDLFFNFTVRNKPPTKEQILKKNYPSKTSVKKIHYECGLMAFSSGLTKKRYPFWHQGE